jgi:hypothetical protein
LVELAIWRVGVRDVDARETLFGATLCRLRRCSSSIQWKMQRVFFDAID